MWGRTATGPEAPPFGMGIEAFGIGPASRFATEHPSLRLKCKPRVKSPASAGLFFTFPAAKQALDSNSASFDPLVGTRQPMEGAAQYREHLQQGLLGLGGRQQQHLPGPAADLPLQGHRQVVRHEPACTDKSRLDAC